MSFNSPIIPSSHVKVRKDSSSEPDLALSLVKQNQDFIEVPDLTVQMKDVLRNIIEDYQKQGEKMLQDAKTKSRQIEGQCREKGFSQGYQRGLSEGKKIVEHLTQILASIDRAKHTYFHDLYPLVVRIICSAIKHVVKILPQHFEEILSQRMEYLFTQLGDQIALEVTLSKEDYSYLKLHLEQISQQIPQIQNVGLNIDTTLRQGDIRIKTDFGLAETIIDEEIQRILDAI